VLSVMFLTWRYCLQSKALDKRGDRNDIHESQVRNRDRQWYAQRSVVTHAATTPSHRYCNHTAASAL